jgi:tRNA threonylcarbamoyladenosine biosynthesis protein TsaB
MKRLIIDTSTGVATALLSRGSDLQAVASTRGSVLSLLHENIDQVLNTTETRIEHVEEVCVVVGPGSWTGLHVGVTTAKTISQYLDVPLVELSILDAFAYSLPATESPIVALLDAKRDCVYSACYLWDNGDMRTLILPEKRHIQEAMNLAADESKTLLLAGARPTQQLAGKYSTRADAVETNVMYPSPQAFIALSEQRSHAGITGTARLEVVPDYMQDDFTITPSSQVIR